MVLTRDIHVFASHKGGTGKTQLCFQTASQYAQDHPEVNVLLIDTTELGDLSKRCLGGPATLEALQNANLEAANRGEQGKQIQTANEVLTFFDIVNKASIQQQEEQQQGGLFSNFTSLFRRKTQVDVCNSAIRPRECGMNDMLPENVYLIAAGSTISSTGSTNNNMSNMGIMEGYNQRSRDETILLANTIRESLEKDHRSWKVYIDTDGDRHPSPNTRLAYALADRCLVPIAADMSDFQRLEPMFELMNNLNAQGEMKCKISLLLWNKLQLYKKEPSTIGDFTTPKVTTDTITALNTKLTNIAKNKYPSIFSHSSNLVVSNNSNNSGNGDFIKASTILVRDFPDTLSIPSNAKGIPFCSMKSGTLRVDGVDFKIGKDQLESCNENVKEILAKLEKMELDYDL